MKSGEGSSETAKRCLPHVRRQLVSAECGRGRYYRADLFQIVSAMNLLWLFSAVAPLAVASLVAFAAHIDPLSGHWRTRRSKDSKDDTADA